MNGHAGGWRRSDLAGLPVLIWEGDEHASVALFLHGVGERGVDGDGALRHGLPSVVSRLAPGGMRVVVPQCPPGSRWTDHLDTPACIAEAAGAPLTVTGFSMGEGVWAFAAAHPELVSRLAPVAARLPVGAAAGDLARGLPDVPIWVIHGTSDESVPVADSDAMVAALDALGRRPTYTRYEGLGHVATCERAYADPAYLGWLSRRVSSVTP